MAVLKKKDLLNSKAKALVSNEAANEEEVRKKIEISKTSWNSIIKEKK